MRDGAERRVLRDLDSLLKGVGVRSAIERVVERVKLRLDGVPDAPMAYEPIPISIYGGPLPGGARSSWVFVLRRGAATGAERHPNSRQRMVSYGGAGDLQTRSGRRWRSHRLASGTEGPIERRWISIPVNVWHQVVVPAEEEGHWAVVSFHTVEAEDLIEERPLHGDDRLTSRRTYLGA